MHNVQSPDNSDPAIERDIAAKGAQAPRVTPESIEDEIGSEWYFTAGEGAAAAVTVSVGAPPYTPQALPLELSLLTFCVLVLRNGFTVVGKSACASPENFDADIGRRVARADAINQCWPLLGFRLRDQLTAFQAI